VFIVYRKETVRPSTIVVRLSDFVQRLLGVGIELTESAAVLAKIVGRFSW
jgi:hypothetical protein